MVFLINATNLKNGGGIQVSQSICGQLINYPQHHFVVMLSSYIDVSIIDFGSNVELIRYDIKNNFATLIRGRDKYLDTIVCEKKIDAVLTIFGPSRWRPRTPHLCGFARAQLLLDSPYNKSLSIKEKIVNRIWGHLFRKCSRHFYTENQYISDLLSGYLGDVQVFTVTNYYNQIYDQPSLWKRCHKLPSYSGISCLSVSTHYPHKNFEIIIDIVRYFNVVYPQFKVRFVLTFNESEMPVPIELRDSFLFIGKVDVSECPYLYEQSDIMFMPTLLECFTATYPEAMRMEKPIVTTDLDFAHGICGDAACYYSAVDAKAAAESIYKVATDKAYSAQLVANGRERLKKFDNYKQRTDKLIKILEEITSEG